MPWATGGVKSRRAPMIHPPSAATPIDTSAVRHSTTPAGDVSERKKPCTVPPVSEPTAVAAKKQHERTPEARRNRRVPREQPRKPRTFRCQRVIGEDDVGLGHGSWTSVPVQ